MKDNCGVEFAFIKIMDECINIIVLYMDETFKKNKHI